MSTFIYELKNGKVRSKKIRGSGREAAMRAAAASPEGTTLIAKASKRRVLVGTRISNAFVRVPSPAGASKSLVCIRSEKTGKTTCVDRPAYRKAAKYDRAVKEGLIPAHVSRRPSEVRANPAYFGSDPRSNPEYLSATPRSNPRRRRSPRRIF